MSISGDDLSSLGNPAEQDDDLQSEVDDERNNDEWDRLPRDGKWKDIFRSLVANVKWDGEDDVPRPILEERKKKALLDPWETVGTRVTVLHMLAEDFEAGDFGKLSETTKTKVMDYLVEDNIYKAQQSDSQDEQRDVAVLVVAIAERNIDFLQYIIDHCAKSLPSLLAVRDHNRLNCLHHAFKTHLPELIRSKTKKQAGTKDLDRKKFFRLLHTFIQSALSDTVTAQDNYKNTPVHYALAYDLCEFPRDFYRLKIVQPLVSKADDTFKPNPERQFNREGQSPYLYFEYTKTLKEVREQELQRTASTGAPPSAKASHLRNNKGSRLEETDGTKIDSPHQRPNEEYPATSQHPGVQKEKQMVAQRGTADGAINHYIAHQSQPNSSGKPQAREAPSTMTSGDKTRCQAESSIEATKTARARKEAARKIRDFLKTHYIRNRSAMQAKELLYGEFSIELQKNMFFDATSQQGKTADEVASYIDKLSQAGGFEDTLSYVILPSLDVPDESFNNPIYQLPTQNESKPRAPGNKNQVNGIGKGRSSLIRVFDELSNRGVSTILRLHVEDLGIPHTDAAIEREIRWQQNTAFSSEEVIRPTPIQVETWYVTRILTPVVYQESDTKHQ